MDEIPLTARFAKGFIGFNTPIFSEGYWRKWCSGREFLRCHLLSNNCSPPTQGAASLSCCAGGSKTFGNGWNSVILCLTVDQLIWDGVFGAHCFFARHRPPAEGAVKILWVFEVKGPLVIPRLFRQQRWLLLEQISGSG
jgi:hypothetical protein